MNTAAQARSDPSKGKELVLVSGMSGAGRSTALRTFEDIGFEVVDNLPLSMVSDLLDGAAPPARIAVVHDVRNREFSPSGFAEFHKAQSERDDLAVSVLFLDCRHDVLVRRFSETRRPHPLSVDRTPEDGLAEEREIIGALSDFADAIIDTSDLGPRDLQAEIKELYGSNSPSPELVVSVQSFSYKRGAPAGLDLMFDCRFLQNPHWVPELRPLTGLDQEVVSYVTSDPRHRAFVDKVLDLLELLLDAVVQEGKSHITVGFGCTGGRHRSVVIADAVAEAIGGKNWQVTKKHWEVG